MKKNGIVGPVICAIICFIFFVFFIYKITSPEIWHAGTHDSKCEKTWNRGSCSCYDRLLKQDKEGK